MSITKKTFKNSERSNDVDRWILYEMLKGTREADAALVESMDPEEIKEGVIEFLLREAYG